MGLEAGAQVAALGADAVVAALVFQRVVQIQVGAVGIEVLGAQLGGGAEVAAGDFADGLEAVGDAIRAAGADAAVVFLVAGGLDRALDVAVRRPLALRVVVGAHHGVGAVALDLGGWHHRRVVLAGFVPQSRAHFPVVAQLVVDVHLGGGGLQALVLHLAVDLAAHADPLGDRHAQGATVLLGVLQRHLARRGVAGVDFLAIDGHVAVRLLVDVAEADAGVDAVGAGADVVVGRQGIGGRAEAEAAVVGEEGGVAEALALRRLELQPGLRALAQGEVPGQEAGLVAGFLAGVAGEADLQGVAEPVVGAHAVGQVLDVLEAGRVLVAGHQVDLVAAAGVGGHQEAVGAARRKRLVEQQPPLQVVDVVVQRRGQVLDRQHHARDLVAHLDPDPVGAGQDVLVAQVVERAAGAAEFVAAGDGAGLGDEAVDHEALLAEAGDRRALVVGVRAVQAAVDVGQRVVRVADLEVAPHGVALVLAQLEVELAEGGRGLLHGAVVTVGGIVVVGVDAAEQRIRRLVHEGAEDVLDRAFQGVGAGGQLPAVAELAVGEEGHAAVDRQVLVVAAALVGHQLDRAVGLRMRQRDVRDADVEPVVLLQLEVAQEQLAVAGVVDHRDFHRVQALRQDLLDRELAVFRHRHRAPGDPDLVTFGDARAVDLDGAAAQVNVPLRHPILAVADQKFLLGVLLEQRLVDLVDQPQGLRRRLVVVALLVVDPEHVLQLATGRLVLGELGLPFGAAVAIHCDDLERSVAQRGVLVEDADLGPVDEAGIVAVGAELHQVLRIFGGGVVLVADRVGPGGGVQPGLQVEVVELELDVGLFQRDVGAALDVGNALVGIVDRLAVDRDAHVVQRIGVGGADLAGHALDVHAVELVEHGELVVDHLHFHP